MVYALSIHECDHTASWRCISSGSKWRVAWVRASEFASMDSVWLPIIDEKEKENADVLEVVEYYKLAENEYFCLF